MELNKAQELAINHKDGPALVLAGPGSGKTYTIVHRVEALIRTHHISPSNILVITFTKAAAEEMQERFFKLMNGKGHGVRFGTFHSVFFTILKYAYHYDVSNILTPIEKSEILHGLYIKEHLELEDEKEFLSRIEEEISKVKSERLPLDHYYSKETSVETFQNFYYGYQKELNRRRRIDFDDMMVYVYELFRARADILSMWQKQYPYILVDEFQDINRLQYDIVKMMAGESKNLFIVGDDDQSIYGFRGSKPVIMRDFETEMKEVTKIFLDTNYRSDQNIVALAGNVIAHNRTRYLKNIQSFHPAENAVYTYQFQNVREESMVVVTKIMEYREKGIPPEEMAVIFRTNHQPRAVAGKLMEHNIPFYMKDYLPNLYEHWIALDLKAYIAIARGSVRRKDYLRIMNRPKRYISRDSLEYPEVDLEQVEEYYQDKPWMQERIEQLSHDLAFLYDCKPYEGILYIRKGIGYEDYLREYAAEHRIDEEELFSILEEITESAKDYRTYEEWFLYINRYSEQLKEQQTKQQEKRGVSLVTMHSAKGLEYEVVFIIDANESITPFHKAVLDEDIEEERRLFYVAMTRAKKLLHIFSVKEYYNKRLSESRFLEEMKENENEGKRWKNTAWESPSGI